jgi:hypothetical protein
MTLPELKTLNDLLRKLSLEVGSEDRIDILAVEWIIFHAAKPLVAAQMRKDFPAVTASPQALEPRTAQDVPGDTGGQVALPIFF